MEDVGEELTEFMGKAWSEIVRRIDSLHSQRQTTLMPINVTTVYKTETDGMRLQKEDMALYGLCPARDEFYLVVCELCGLLVKPQAFQQHIDLRHVQGSSFVHPEAVLDMSHCLLMNYNTAPSNSVEHTIARKPSRTHIIKKSGSSTPRGTAKLLTTSKIVIVESEESRQPRWCSDTVIHNTCVVSDSLSEWDQWTNACTECYQNSCLTEASSSQLSGETADIVACSMNQNIQQLVCEDCNDFKIKNAPSMRAEPPFDSISKISLSPAHSAPPTLDIADDSFLLADSDHGRSVHVNGVTPLHDATNAQLSTDDCSHQVMPWLGASSLSEQTILQLMSSSSLPPQQSSSNTPLLKAAASLSLPHTDVGSKCTLPITFANTSNSTISIHSTTLMATSPSGVPVPSTLQSSTEKKSDFHSKPGHLSCSQKVILCKDREYDPNKHCGVWLADIQKPCTRSLTCKTHSRSLRRAVAGRSKLFDVLLQEQRERRTSMSSKYISDKIPDSVLPTFVSHDQTDIISFCGVDVSSGVVSGVVPSHPSLARLHSSSASLPTVPVSGELQDSRSVNLSSIVVSSLSGQVPLTADSGYLTNAFCNTTTVNCTTGPSWSELCSNRDEAELKVSQIGSAETLTCSCSSSFRVNSTSSVHAPLLVQHPKPLAVNGFGAWLHGDTCFVFNRASDLCRAAFVGALEHHLNPPPHKKLCIESSLVHGAVKETVVDPFGFASTSALQVAVSPLSSTSSQRLLNTSFDSVFELPGHKTTAAICDSHHGHFLPSSFIPKLPSHCIAKSLSPVQNGAINHDANTIGDMAECSSIESRSSRCDVAALCGVDSKPSQPCSLLLGPSWQLPITESDCLHQVISGKISIMNDGTCRAVTSVGHQQVVDRRPAILSKPFCSHFVSSPSKLLPLDAAITEVHIHHQRKLSHHGSTVNVVNNSNVLS